MKTTILTVQILVAGFAAGLSPAQTVSKTPVRQRLAEEFSRPVLVYLQTEPLSVSAVEAASLLAQEAAAIDPENVDNWRLLLDVALLIERDDLEAQAVDNILRLDPGDEVARLRRINRSIETRQTAEERVKSFQALLAPDNIDQVGAPVASRLALDLALLQRRMGNIGGFTDALTQALAFDSTNHAAAALAAGYFRANVKDPFAEAELLVNVLLSNSTDIPTQVALARLLLENGAYASAARMYDLAVESTQTSGEIPDTDLIIDQAIAHWANGDATSALQMLTKRVMAIDVVFRQQVRRAQPEMLFEEFTRVRAPKDPSLTTAQAVVSTDDNPSAAAAFANAAIEAYQARIAALATPNPEASSATSAQSSVNTTQPSTTAPSEDIAAANLEAAWLSVWLAQDADRAAAFLAEAEKVLALTPAARERFEGWMSLRRGEHAEAEAALAPLAAADPAARLGLALALQQQGRMREAAVELLAVTRAQPGSLIGIWAANRLLGIVGQRVSISDQARRMDELIANLPSTVFRAATAANTAVSLRLEVSSQALSAYEPIMVVVRVTNNSQLPLAINRDGPLRTQVLLMVTASAANLPMLGDLPPIVVDLERTFRLEPRQSLVIPVDLRRTGVGQLLNNIARNGSLLSIRGYLNFYATGNGALRPGLYGCDVSAPLVRVEGARATADWMRDTLDMLTAPEFPNQDGMLPRMALLGHRLATPFRPDATDEDKQLVQRAAEELSTAFGKLDELSQAWLLTVIPSSEALAGLIEIGQRSDSRVVKVAYLLTQAKPGDPAIAAAKASDDAALRRFGEFMDSIMATAATQPAQDQPGAVAVEQPASAPSTRPTEQPSGTPSPKPTSRPIVLPPAATPPPTDSPRP